MSRKARTIGEFMGWIKRLVAGDADAKRLVLSERDSLRILDLLENPPAAPDCLVRAAKAAHPDIDLAPERIRFPCATLNCNGPRL